MKKTFYYSMILTLLVLFGLLQFKPWHRNNEVFYAPLLLPITALKGDIIITSNNRAIVLDCDQTIKSIDTYNDRVIITATKHLTLWDILIGKDKLD